MGAVIVILVMIRLHCGNFVNCECAIICLLLYKVGNMFDTIQRNNGLTQDWSILLIQLVSSGVVDIQNNRYDH